MSGTLHETIAFNLPATAREAAVRSRRSISEVLDIAGESLVAVHAAMKRFGRAEIERELGSHGPQTLKAYDAFIELVGEDWLSQEDNGS